MKTLFIKVVGLVFFLSLSFYLGTLFQASNAKPDEAEIYALADGEVISARDVEPRIKEDLRQIEKNKYLIKKQAVLDLLQEKHQKSQPPVDQLPEPTDEEIKAFLKERNLNLSKLSASAKRDLMNNIKLNQAMLARKIQTEKIENSKIEWMIPMTFLGTPKNIGTGFLPELASKSGKKELIIFGYYHCPNCREIPSKIKAIKEKLKDQVSIHFRYSLTEPEPSIIAQSAMAAACANDQEKFASYHEALFEKPASDTSQLIELARQQGLKLDEFEKCLQSNKFKSEIARDLKAAEELNVQGRAVAFANGYQLELQEPLSEFFLILNQSK